MRKMESSIPLKQLWEYSSRNGPRVLHSIDPFEPRRLEKATVTVKDEWLLRFQILSKLEKGNLLETGLKEIHLN